MTIKKITHKEEINLDTKDLIVIDFYADWCGPCQMISREIKEIAKQYKDLTIYKVNIDEFPDMAMEYDVLSIPTLLFIKDNEIKDEVIGYKDRIFISDRIDENL
jgi:thioredoxin